MQFNHLGHHEMDKRCMSKIVLNKHVSVNTCSTCYYVLFVHFMIQNTEVHFDNSVTCSIYHYRKNRSPGGGGRGWLKDIYDIEQYWIKVHYTLSRWTGYLAGFKAYFLLRIKTSQHLMTWNTDQACRWLHFD